MQPKFVKTPKMLKCANNGESSNVLFEFWAILASAIVK